MRILIVDDSPDCIAMAKAMLMSAGYVDIITAGSAEEAYTLLGIDGGEAEHPAPDLVLLDVMMPGVNGIEACAQIRRDPRYLDLPVLMVTGVRDMDSLDNAFIAGASDYIMKPVNRTEIIARVRSALMLKSELDRRRLRERDLLQFMSTWVDRRGSQWIDGVSRLFVGEVAEAYLLAVADCSPEQDISVIAVGIDSLQNFRAQDTEAAEKILARVAGEVRALAAKVGVVAGAYRSGVIVLIVPDLPGSAAKILGEEVKDAIAQLRIPAPRSDRHVSASVSVMTAKAAGWSDQVDLLSRALTSLPKLPVPSLQPVEPPRAHA